MTPLEEFLYYVSPALTGALVGALMAALLTGLVVQRYFVNRANQSALIDYIIKELDELRSDCLNYWAVECKDRSKSPKTVLLEEKLRANLESIAEELAHFIDKYKDKKGVLAKFPTELADACTGGTFQSKKRAADFSRIRLIVKCISKIKSELLRKKL